MKLNKDDIYGIAGSVAFHLFILLIPVGAVTQLETVWSISDTLNGLMVVPNLIGLLGLSGVVFRATRDYRRRETMGKKTTKL